MPLKFFITHSSKDVDFAKRLCNDLTAQGLQGFFDVYSVKPGDDIPKRIAHGLEQCDVYVPILSPASLASPWSDLEINAAIMLNRERTRNGRPRIIPIIAQSCQVPILLRPMFCIEFVGRYEEALVELLTTFYAPQAQTPPSPQVAVPTAPKIETPPRPILGIDGKEMILIPAGEFEMGGEDIYNAKPVHEVYLNAFYLDQYPVTNAEYQRFVDATEHAVPYHWPNGRIPQGKENHPVTCVSWNDAAEYAAWAGGRLPTEAEWEKAAGWDGIKKKKRIYPWGDSFDARKCNSYESKIGGTTSVGEYSPAGDSPYGIGDMAGNVLEWCSSKYVRYPYSASDGREDVKSVDVRCVRGGSWFNLADFARCANRNGYQPDYRFTDIGFRVAMTVSAEI